MLIIHASGHVYVSASVLEMYAASVCTETIRACMYVSFVWVPFECVHVQFAGECACAPVFVSLVSATRAKDAVYER